MFIPAGHTVSMFHSWTWPLSDQDYFPRAIPFDLIHKWLGNWVNLRGKPIWFQNHSRFSSWGFLLNDFALLLISMTQQSSPPKLYFSPVIHFHGTYVFLVLLLSCNVILSVTLFTQQDAWDVREIYPDGSIILLSSLAFQRYAACLYWGQAWMQVWSWSQNWSRSFHLLIR